jgi:hypothetical protein
MDNCGVRPEVSALRLRRPCARAHPKKSRNPEPIETAPHFSACNLSKAQVIERLADQDRTRDGPVEHQRLAIAEAERQRDDAVDEEAAEQPRGDVGFGQTATLAGRQDDRNRCRRRKQECHNGVGEIDAAKAAEQVRRIELEAWRSLERHGAVR